MKKYIALRLLSTIPIVLVTSFVIFVLLRVCGSDPVASYLLNSQLPATPEIITQLRAEFGLDKPILQQYVAWLGGAIKLDFGVSYMSGREVASDFAEFLPVSAALIACGLGIVCLGSVVLGILSARFANTALDFIIRAFCFIGVSMPNFWLAFLLMLLFSLHLGWLAPLGLEEGARSFILPAISISLMSLCINTRLVRANMLEVAKERHILYARLRGLPSGVITVRHIFYNASLPIITAMGMHLGELLGAALVVENIYALPGIGLYAIQAIANHDYPVIECFFVLMCVVFVLSNAIIDIIYALLDPRLARER